VAEKSEKTEKKTAKAAPKTKAAAKPATPARATARVAAARPPAAQARATAPARAVAPTAARPVAAVPARPVSKRTVARKRAAPVEGATAEQLTAWRRLRRKTKVGVVVSAKQAKTVIVEVGRQRKHPLYKKVVRLRKRFATHDENGEARAGDLVRIQESRPYSATKRWKIAEVLSRAGEAGAAAPRVADVEKALEEAEGVAELLAAPGSPKADQSAETGPQGRSEEPTA
jgi:small subunit ribosomal protein S17